MPNPTNPLEERLNKILAERSGSAESMPIRNQCVESSWPRNGDQYGPEGVYRCRKERGHSGRHKDDHGTEWDTEPHFRIWIRARRGPRESST
jgi:hypothetical protein